MASIVGADLCPVRLVPSQPRIEPARRDQRIRGIGPSTVAERLKRHRASRAEGKIENLHLIVGKEIPSE